MIEEDKTWRIRPKNWTIHLKGKTSSKNERKMG